MKRLALVVCALLLAAPVFSAADVTGKWSGSFVISVTGPDGQSMQNEAQIVMDLTQKGTELSGTAGPNAEKQGPIQKGKVDGNKVTFEVREGTSDTSPLLAFNLTLVDGHLKGEANAESQGRKMKAVVDAQRKTY